MRSVALFAVAVLVSVLLCLLFALPSASAVTITVNITPPTPSPNQPFTVSGQFVGYGSDVQWILFIYSGGDCLHQLIGDLGYTGPDGDYSLTVAGGEPAGTYSVLVEDFFGDSSGCIAFTVGAPSSVGGVVMPANTFALIAPWLALIGLVGCIGTVVVIAKKRR